MFNKIKNIIFKPEGLESVETAKDVVAEFEVRYGELLVGMLRHGNGQWTFAYSPEFKEAHLRPITDFPELDRNYAEKDLWPYFASRIPSLENPRVQLKLKQEKVKATDEVGLLRLFGKRTIANPLELIALG